MEKDWLTIYLGHARHFAYQTERQPEVISHLWHIAFLEDWQPLKDYLHQAIGLPTKTVVSSLGLGHWVSVDVHVPDFQFGVRVGRAPCDRFDDRVALVEQDHIQLSRSGQILAKRPIEPAPLTTRKDAQKPQPQDQAIIFSSTGRWLWHLGYQNQCPFIVLMDGFSLDVIDTFEPVSWSHYDRGQALSEWSDGWWGLEASVSKLNPDVLLVYANYGDRLHVFLTLCATSNGIGDPGGAVLFENVYGALHMYLTAAHFLSEDRLLVSEDTGVLTLFSWPDADEILFKSILEELSSEDYTIQLWPGDEPTDMSDFMLEELAVVGGDLFASITDGATYVAFAVLDPETLKFRGLVRLPESRLGGFFQYRDNIFRSQEDKPRFWRYEAFDIPQ